MPQVENEPFQKSTGYDDVVIILLEMQSPMLAAARTHLDPDLRRSAAVLAGIARSLGIPLLASAVPFGGQPPVLVEELADIEPMTRSVVSPFDHGPTAVTLREGGRRTLLVGGVSSEIAILRTALDALREGYHVHVLVDLCGGLSARTEASAFDQMKAAGVTLSNVSSFFTGRLGDLGSAEGETVMGGVARLWSWENAR